MKPEPIVPVNCLAESAVLLLVDLLSLHIFFFFFSSLLLELLLELLLLLRRFPLEAMFLVPCSIVGVESMGLLASYSPSLVELGSESFN